MIALKKIAVPLVVGAVLLLLWVRSGDHTETQMVSTQRSSKKGFRALYRGPRAPIVPKKAPAEISKECLFYFESVRSINLDDLLDFPPRVELPRPGKCTNIPIELGQYHQLVQEQCRGFSLEKAEQSSAEDWERAQGKCMTSLALYRSLMTAYLTKDEPIENISDPKVLADHLFASHQVLMTDEKAPKKLEQAAERLLSLEPDMYEAAQALFSARMLQALSNDKPTSETWKKAEQAQAMKEQMRPEAVEENLDGRLSLEYMRSDGPELEQIAQREAEAHPQSPIPKRFLAMAAHMNGDSPRAIKLLKDLEKDPKVGAELKQMLREDIRVVMEGKKKSFGVRFGWDFNMSEGS